jgi:drug/metabolite transporter (DMT)-like permease
MELECFYHIIRLFYLCRFRMNSNQKAHLAVFCTNLFFAANYTFIKYVSPSVVGPYALNIFRVGGSILLFWMVWLFKTSSVRIEKRDIGRFLLCALTGVALNQMLFIKGLTMTTTIHASLLALATPIVVTLFALWMLNEHFTFLKALGLSLGVGGGILLIMQKENSGHAPNYLLGDFLILVNAISYSFYFILVKPLMTRYSALNVIRWVFTMGFFMILPLAWPQMKEIRWEMMDYTHIVALILIVLTGTFLAYYFNIYGLQHLGAGVTGAYIYTQPVLAALIATFALGEKISIQKILAAALIFGGVYLVSLKQRKWRTAGNELTEK